MYMYIYTYVQGVVDLKSAISDKPAANYAGTKRPGNHLREALGRLIVHRARQAGLSSNEGPVSPQEKRQLVAKNG